MDDKDSKTAAAKNTVDFDSELPISILIQKKLTLAYRFLHGRKNCSRDILTGSLALFDSVEKFSSSQLATGITRLEQEVMARIPSSEFEDLKWTHPDASTKAPFLTHYIRHFNEARQATLLLA